MKICNKYLIIIISIVSFVLGLSGPIDVLAAGPAVVNLGTAANFVILAETWITDVPTSAITGDIGVSSATGAQIGVTCAEITGKIYTVDALAAYAGGPGGSGDNTCVMPGPGANKTIVDQAVLDMGTAYTNASAPATPAGVGAFLNIGTPAGTLSGLILVPGVYTWGSNVAITGDITLSGGADDVWIFQITGTLNIATGKKIILSGGAQAKNVFWQVTDVVSLLANSQFKGNILAQTQITMGSGAILDGRALAQTQVTLIANTVSIPVALVSTPTPTPTPTPIVLPASYYRGTINVVKIVINDNGGTKTVADFPLFIDGTPVVSGITYTFHAPASAFTVTETNDANYTRTFSGDCDMNGQFNLNPGDQKFCIVTNDDIGASLVVPPVPPLIDIVKTANPLSLPAGPGSVVYTYTLRNIGTIPVTNITIVGDTCSSIILASGDINADAKLDVNETWVYTCTQTLSETHTNTAVTTGWANGISAVDIASATVIVGKPVVPPLIHVVKKPNVLVAPLGGAVTYTYTVTNPGTAPLSNVSIIDDRCTGLPGRVSGHPGDLNGNNQLESNESWNFTCQTNLTQTTINIGTAKGSANGLTATDLSVATVVVTPKFPNTGIASYTKNILWNIVILVLAGIFAVLTFLYFTRRK